MEVEDFASQLQLRLAEKNENSPTYRKAEGVLASLLHAAKTVSNLTCRSPTFPKLTPSITRPWLYTSLPECSNCSNALSKENKNTNIIWTPIFCSSLLLSLKPPPTHLFKAELMLIFVMQPWLFWEEGTTRPSWLDLPHQCFPTLSLPPSARQTSSEDRKKLWCYSCSRKPSHQPAATSSAENAQNYSFISLR